MVSSRSGRSPHARAAPLRHGTRGKCTTAPVIGSVCVVVTLKSVKLSSVVVAREATVSDTAAAAGIGMGIGNVIAGTGAGAGTELCACACARAVLSARGTTSGSPSCLMVGVGAARGHAKGDSCGCAGCSDSPDLGKLETS